MVFILLEILSLKVYKPHALVLLKHSFSVFFSVLVPVAVVTLLY